MMPKYVLVSGNDWEGFYRDGVLVMESHTLAVADIIAVGVLEGEVRYLTKTQDRALCRDGALPRSLFDVERLGAA